MNVFPSILAKNKNFKKLRQCFVDERALITTTLKSACHWKTLVPFCLLKKRPENAFLKLIANYRKIVQKNKSCHKNSNKLTIWWYMMLFIHCVFWLKNWRFSTNSYILKFVLFYMRCYTYIKRKRGLKLYYLWIFNKVLLSKKLLH